ncbi:MAG: OmpA family protein [Deltaproteobacteria bacterium]
MVTQPPTRSFGIGGSVTGRLSFRLAGPLSVQAGVGSWWFRNRDPSLQGGAAGQATEVAGGLRLSHHFSERIIGGPFVDANAGLALTGGLRRFMFDVAIGWEFALDPAISAGIFARYGQIVQPDSEPVPQDARFVSGGVVLVARIPPRGPGELHILDDDGDGIPNAVDHCPQQPEDFDRFEDSDGCRDPDNDEDGILDARDQCPFESESRNHFQDDDGCPDDAPVAVAEVRNDHIEISQSIRFQLGTATIVVDSYPILTQVATLLATHAEISRVRIEGHADERGDVEFNQRLSESRAAAIVGFLRDHGAVDADLEPVGFGTSRPLCQQATERCYAINRRVEFVILEITHPAQSSATPSGPPASLALPSSAPAGRSVAAASSGPPSSPSTAPSARTHP